jgi:hypothetical protein
MRAVVVIIGVLPSVSKIAALFAPYVDAELAVWTLPHTIVDAARFLL